MLFLSTSVLVITGVSFSGGSQKLNEIFRVESTANERIHHKSYHLIVVY